MSYEDILKRHEQEASTFSEGKIYFIFASNETDFLNKLEEKGLKPDDLRSLGAGVTSKKNM